MKVPIPRTFGNYAECNNRQLPFSDVSWFRWSRGMEYTYFFLTSDKWHPIDFYTTFENVQPFEFVVPDELLTDDFIKHKMRKLI